MRPARWTCTVEPTGRWSWKATLYPVLDPTPSGRQDPSLLFDTPEFYAFGPSARDRVVRKARSFIAICQDSHRRAVEFGARREVVDL